MLCFFFIVIGNNCEWSIWLIKISNIIFYNELNDVFYKCWKNTGGYKKVEMDSCCNNKRRVSKRQKYVQSIISNNISWMRFNKKKICLHYWNFSFYFIPPVQQFNFISCFFCCCCFCLIPFYFFLLWQSNNFLWFTEYWIT